MKTTNNVTIETGPKSTVIIKAEIEASVFESYRAHAIEHAGSNIEIPGFRKGKAPEAILLKHIPEMAILEEMAEHAIKDAYPKIIEEHKIDAIGQPMVSITKIASGSPLAFTIETAVLPKVDLPDYKKIASREKVKEVKVEEKEISDTIETIRKNRALQKKGPEAKAEEIKEEELEAVTDEFVKELGPFENVEDFKKKLAENIRLEKEHHEREKHRLTIIENILKEMKVEIPEILVNAELDKMLYRMKSDITNMGLSFEDYLKHLKKTEDEIRKEFEEDAKKRASIEIMLEEIARTEKIVADKEKVDADVARIMEEYKEADPTRTRVYVEMMLRSEAVFQFLENQSK